MFYAMPRPNKGRSKLQSMRQRSQCHRERAPYDAPPEKKKEQMTITAATVALSPRTCCIRWPAREPNERAHRFGIFLEDSKMLTARTCFGKCREAWWTIAPRRPMQSGGRARTSPPLWNVCGCLTNADAPRVLWKISVSMVIRSAHVCYPET